MVVQMSIFDIMEGAENIPSVNDEGYIPSEELVPLKWEAWKYSNSEWTMNGGKPYIIDAVLAILPGNRLYVKDWMMYPFMYELKSAGDVLNMYCALRKKIVERKARNNDVQKTWQTDELPLLEDMWEYQEGEYSCKEYAQKTLYGYGVKR